MNAAVLATDRISSGQLQYRALDGAYIPLVALRIACVLADAESFTSHNGYSVESRKGRQLVGNHHQGGN